MQTKFHVIGAVLLLAIAVLSQTSTQLPELDKNGKPVFPRPMPHVVYSPGDLAHNATVLPASAATPNTNVVRAGAATKLTLFVNCTQIVNVSVNVYTADDQSSSTPNWSLYGTYVLVNGAAAGAQQIYVATELAPNTTSGTVATNFRLPQLALSFFETNTTATPGTCTDRVIVGY